ncbi:unnamed protein product [Amoebophrya sp. A120]|nr:unnamed protein product [Amoebophrya sp. A120]|eukprot:GSA120T00007861001.1
MPHPAGLPCLLCGKSASACCCKVAHGACTCCGHVCKDLLTCCLMCCTPTCPSGGGSGNGGHRSSSGAAPGAGTTTSIAGNGAAPPRSAQQEPGAASRFPGNKAATPLTPGGVIFYPPKTQLQKTAHEIMVDEQLREKHIEDTVERGLQMFRQYHESETEFRVTPGENRYYTGYFPQADLQAHVQQHCAGSSPEDEGQEDECVKQVPSPTRERNKSPKKD